MDNTKSNMESLDRCCSRVFHRIFSFAPFSKWLIAYRDKTDSIQPPRFPICNLLSWCELGAQLIHLRVNSMSPFIYFPYLLRFLFLLSVVARCASVDIQTISQEQSFISIECPLGTFLNQSVCTIIPAGLFHCIYL